MRLAFVASICLAGLFSCTESTSTSSTSDSAQTTDAAPPESVQYAYSINHPDSWEWGSKKNTETALNALKAFETGDIDGGMKYWGDSVMLEFDNFDKKLSNDSVKLMFTAMRGALKDVKVYMQDFESVKSDARGEEWVSLWYKQYNTDMKGNQDSIECMDDLLMKDGKIVLLSEKTRKLGPPKK